MSESCRHSTCPPVHVKSWPLVRWFLEVGEQEMRMEPLGRGLLRRPKRVALPLLPQEDTAKRQPSMAQEAGPPLALAACLDFGLLRSRTVRNKFLWCISTRSMVFCYNTGLWKEKWPGPAHSSASARFRACSSTCGAVVVMRREGSRGGEVRLMVTACDLGSHPLHNLIQPQSASLQGSTQLTPPTPVS